MEPCPKCNFELPDGAAECPACGIVVEKYRAAAGRSLPSPPVRPVPTEPEDFEEQQLRAFVGRKADYYLKKWNIGQEGAGQAPGLNWAAFFLPGLWLPYRKMYRTATIFLGSLLLLSVAEEVLFLGILGEAETPPLLDSLIGLGAGVICGANGNRWYLARARRAIAEARARGLDPYAVSAFVADRGGTNLGAAIGICLLYAVLMVGFLLFLAPFLYPA